MPSSPAELGRRLPDRYPHVLETLAFAMSDERCKNTRVRPPISIIAQAAHSCYKIGHQPKLFRNLRHSVSGRLFLGYSQVVPYVTCHETHSFLLLNQGD